MVSKSKSYAFRLHPNVGKEADAMAIIKQRLGNGYTLREIMCDAILHSAGRIPNLYPEPPENHLTRAHFDTVVADLKARNQELQERLDAATDKHLTSERFDETIEEIKAHNKELQERVEQARENSLTNTHFDNMLNELAVYIREVLAELQPSRQRFELTQSDIDLQDLLSKAKGKPTNVEAISRAKKKLDKLGE